jgi:Uma2 family endonuclease
MVVKLPTSVQPVTHLDLPDTDGKPVDNDFQFTQAMLLTTAIRPLMDAACPKGDYFIGNDVGIYWKWTDPPLDGCKSPDWYFVPGCRPDEPGTYRRSFVIWDEGVAPLIVIEFVSGDGSEEHDDTPGSGKFWVYRRGIRAFYYAIHDPIKKTLEVYQLDGVEYRELAPSEDGLHRLPRFGFALGHWNGKVDGHTLTWLRFYSMDGQLVPSERERRELMEQSAEKEKERAEKAEAELAELRAKLQAKGIDPNAI